MMRASSLALSSLVLACDLAGPRPAPSESAAAAAALPAAAPQVSAPNTGPIRTSPGAVVPSVRCIVPRAEPPPPVAAPASRCPADPGAPAELPSAQVHFSDAPDVPSVTVELARTDADRSRGLMYRTALDGDHGMLFSWEQEARRSFWMQNTCIPLDMLFIAADGTIVGILEQVPTLNTLPREVPCAAQHVLEVNAGWTRAHGVEPGQHVELET